MEFKASFILGILLVLVPKFSLQQQCNSTGDLGRTQCVLLTPVYNAHQWATCLTEDYIMRASDGRHICASETARQCWYQCMIEIYGVAEGSVNSDCGCSPGEMLPNDLSRLEAECYSPRGDDCEWYRNCLARRYECPADENYAIDYALKFCNLYTDNFEDFSIEGRQWVNAVRYCLQLQLVPYLRLWATYTCAEIRTEAFNGHPACYTGVSPSMCELGCGDIWRAFVVVNLPDGDLSEGALYTTPIATAKQMLAVMEQCYTNEELTGCVKNLLTTLEIAVQLVGRNNPYIRAATTAFLVARHFATVLNWEDNGLGWFPLDGDDDDDDDDERDREKRQNADEEVLNVRVLLVDTKLLNISNGTMSQPTSGQTIDQAIDDLVNAVMNGSLSMIPLNINNTEVISSLSMVNQCMDVGCNSTANMTELVTPPPTQSVTTPTASSTTDSPTTDSPTEPPSGGGTDVLHLHYLALYTAFAAMLLMK